MRGEGELEKAEQFVRADSPVTGKRTCLYVVIQGDAGFCTRVNKGAKLITSRKIVELPCSSGMAKSMTWGRAGGSGPSGLSYVSGDEVSARSCCGTGGQAVSRCHG